MRKSIISQATTNKLRTYAAIAMIAVQNLLKRGVHGDFKATCLEDAKVTQRISVPLVQFVEIAVVRSQSRISTRK